MKLPSIPDVGAEYGRTFRRFPLVMLAAVIGTVAAIAMIQHEGPERPSVLYNMLLTSIVALPLLGALALAVERSKHEGNRGWIWHAAGVLLLVLYAFTIPTDLYRAPMLTMFRFAAVGIGCALLVSFLPFLKRGEINGFWQFSRIVVFRIILAGAFGAVLFAGLVLALAALDNLFGMNIQPKMYLELWVLIVGLFVVTFVLAGTPKNLDQLDQVDEYPRSLKVFGQYVLAPLVCVYFVILYAYIAKIVATWNWPQGWVGRLILGFAGAGILALFVLDPLRKQTQTSWIARATRWYYIILLPLIPVLFLALWERIGQYGITEGRYLGLAVGIWLTFIAGYFLLSSTKSIKIIPISLCVLAFGISFGPWGMFSISERSQVKRLEELLSKNSLLVNDEIVKATSRVPNEDVVEISSILSYLREVHGYGAIQPWFSASLQQDTGVYSGRAKDPSDVTNILGIEFLPFYHSNQFRSYSVRMDQDQGVSIAGYDHLMRTSYPQNMAKRSVDVLTETIAIATFPDSLIVRLSANGVPSDSLRFVLMPLYERLIEKYGEGYEQVVSAEEASVELTTDGIRARLIFPSLTLHDNDTTLTATYYEALLLYSKQSDSIK